MRSLRSVAALVLLLWPPRRAQAQELTLSVAISMREAVQELGRSSGQRAPA